jgi:hypothetical protein
LGKRAVGEHAAEPSAVDETKKVMDLAREKARLEEMVRERDERIAELEAAGRLDTDERESEVKRLSMMLVDLRQRVNEGKNEVDQKGSEINRLSQILSAKE